MPTPAFPHHARGARRQAATLITGAAGEVGHGLMVALAAAGRCDLVALDVRELERDQRALCRDALVGDICQPAFIQRVQAMYEVTEIYHLAAVLSTRAEFAPEAAQEVNVGGTIQLLRLAAEQTESHGQRVRFLFPSSIAAYGLPDLESKRRAGPLAEEQHTNPTTMYGCNKLCCEHLGRYYSRHYRQLVRDRVHRAVDFRCLRFPGLISAVTVPSGGTSDYAAEMIHAAAEGRPYAAFVRPDTRIPFMTMAEAIDALLALAAADEGALSRCVYNVSSFSATAEELAALVRAHFPEARISFAPDPQRQAIVDSWPEELDTAAARRDWGFRPRHDATSAFEEYLVPGIAARYASAG
jgi:nucleoside-diphosphate-sugar epimerase